MCKFLMKNMQVYCEIIYFRGAQFSWIHENGYIRGDVISWIGWFV